MSGAQGRTSAWERSKRRIYALNRAITSRSASVVSGLCARLTGDGTGLNTNTGPARHKPPDRLEDHVLLQRLRLPDRWGIPGATRFHRSYWSNRGSLAPAVIAGMLVVLAVGTTVALILVYRAIPVRGIDRVSVLTLITGMSTLIVAFIAGIVAVLAYYVSVQRPLLEIEVIPGFVPGPMAPDGKPRLIWSKFTIRIHNVRSTSAQNPAVRFALIQISSSMLFTGLDGWVQTPPFTTIVDRGYLWEGGPSRSIHGPRWHIDAPIIDLGQPFRLPHEDQAWIYVEAFSDRDHTSALYEVPPQLVESWGPTQAVRPTGPDRVS